jgi:hypothetical protein
MRTEKEIKERIKFFNELAEEHKDNNWLGLHFRVVIDLLDWILMDSEEKENDD